MSTLENSQVTREEVSYIFEQIRGLNIRRFDGLRGLMGETNFDLLEHAYHYGDEITSEIHDAAQLAIDLFFCRALMAL